MEQENVISTKGKMNRETSTKTRMHGSLDVNTIEGLYLKINSKS